MLTTDMLRYRTKKGVIVPKYIPEDDEILLDLAESLIAAYNAAIGERRAQLQERLDDVVADMGDLILRKGLIKLLDDRSEFEVISPVEPKTIRRVVFDLSAKVHPVCDDERGDDDVFIWTDGGLEQPEMVPDILEETPAEAGGGGNGIDGAGETEQQSLVSPHFGFTRRRTVLEQAAEELGMSADEVLTFLYGDLPAAQVLTKFKNIKPVALLQRYNVALAQAVLYRATDLKITIKGNSQKRYRDLFRGIKFHRLMHRIVETKKGAYDIQLDGPISLFKSSQKYGLQMALFLPILLKCKGWKLEGELTWGKKREARAFKLTPRAGLTSHYPDRGQYQTQEEKWFIERFEARDTPWTLDFSPPPITLPNQNIIIPDLALRHPDGRMVMMEIIGFWRKGSLMGRLEQLREHRVDNLILAVSKNMQGSVEGLGEVPSEIIYFRDIIPPKAVLQRAEAMSKAEE